MYEDLSCDELVCLVRRVFSPGPEDRRLGIMLDLPDARNPDTEAWRIRRTLGAGWARQLSTVAAEMGLQGCDLVLYPNVGAQNGELPTLARIADGATAPSPEVGVGVDLSFAEVFGRCSMLLAPTQFSATAPLKVAARTHPFRAATMPGFSPSMLPALRLDYGEISRRVARARDLLERASSCELSFLVGDEVFELLLDLRHREAHASDGLLPRNGVAGNLPSGEAYIVPYEGEIPGLESRSRGRLPVQHGDEVVVYEILGNRAVDVLSGGTAAARALARLREEPAVGNLAELGIGVLGDMGVEPTGEVLLDEKLGVHIAFGRSDHFGGHVGPSRAPTPHGPPQFSLPERASHVDHVYVPGLQPLVRLDSVVLRCGHGESFPLVSKGRMASF
jgi:hypothetical protein